MTKLAVFPLVRPDVPKLSKWKKSLDSIYKSNHFSNGGDTWKSLNNALSEFFPGRSVVAIGNNTAGQISVLDALQIRGKKVAVSNYTFPATLHAVIHAGGIPVIVDVEMETGEIGVSSLKSAFQEHDDISLVLYTRTFGRRNSTLDVEDFLKSRNVPLVIDAAAGFPTKPAPFSSAIEVFSFHATKAFSVGEGGAIAGPEEQIKIIWDACNFGIQSTDSFTDGINSKMDEFTAARSLAMLKNFPRIAKKRENFVKFVYGDLERNSDIEVFSNNGSWAWSLYPIKFGSRDSLERFALLTTESGLSGKNYYAPSMSKGYRGSAFTLKTNNLENSESWANLTYCLPVYSKYSQKELIQIRRIVNSSL